MAQSNEISDKRLAEMIAEQNRWLEEGTQVVYTTEAWDEMIAAKNSGAKIEITEEVYDYFLEVLPPVYMGRSVALPGLGTRRVDFGFAEGYELVTAFWRENGKFYCMRTNEMNRG